MSWRRALQTMCTWQYWRRNWFAIGLVVTWFPLSFFHVPEPWKTVLGTGYLTVALIGLVHSITSLASVRAQYHYHRGKADAATELSELLSRTNDELRKQLGLPPSDDKEKDEPWVN